MAGVAGKGWMAGAAVMLLAVVVSGSAGAEAAGGRARIRLISRGDDAGSCQSANRAVLEAHRKGLLRNASIMVPGPEFEAAARLLRDQEDLCIGLHVTLNAEWDEVKWGPVLGKEKAPTLVDGKGNFFGTPKLLSESKPDVEQMMAEVSAQLQRAREAGLKVRYMDEHMGVGWVAGLRGRLKELAQREKVMYAEGIPGLPALRERKGDLVEQVMARLAATSPGTYVLVTHPGFDAEDMRRFRHAGLEAGQVARERDEDRMMWSDERLRRACGEMGVEMIHYTEARVAQSDRR